MGRIRATFGPKKLIARDNIPDFFNLKYYILIVRLIMQKFSHFLIGAATSGSGKTTLTLGLAQACRDLGYQVQPFKCGPDYIDTKYHDVAADRPSINLDTFLASQGHVQDLYARYAQNRNVCIIEGVMGLFDGYDKALGSSAQIARLLGVPVILVVNATATAYSVAPLLHGFQFFWPDLKIAGVIFNFVAGESHYRYLCEACADAGLTPLGYLPKNNDIEIPARHLGLNLDMAMDSFCDKAAQLIKQHIDIDLLLGLCAADRPVVNGRQPSNSRRLKIALARDAAFNFMYHENLQALRRLGNITSFSPLADERLPDTDLVYLPGGYPELHLERLSGNTAMQSDIMQYVDNGGKLWAECGGMMYLCNSITDMEGKRWPMTGVYPQKATMKPMKLMLGYRSFEYNQTVFKGHEFHYSMVEAAPPSIVQQYNAKGLPVDTKVWRYKNALASYTHIYWAEHDNLLKLFC